MASASAPGRLRLASPQIEVLYLVLSLFYSLKVKKSGKKGGRASIIRLTSGVVVAEERRARHPQTIRDTNQPRYTSEVQNEYDACRRKSKGAGVTELSPWVTVLTTYDVKQSDYLLIAQILLIEI